MKKLRAKKELITMIENPNVGARIRAYREAMGMTQAELSKEIGICAMQISSIERGQKGISLDRLILFCRRFNLCLDDLIPIDLPDETIREQWCTEIMSGLDELNIVQLGMLRGMIKSAAAMQRKKSKQLPKALLNESE